MSPVPFYDKKKTTNGLKYLHMSAFSSSLMYSYLSFPLQKDYDLNYTKEQKDHCNLPNTNTGQKTIELYINLFNKKPAQTTAWKVKQQMRIFQQVAYLCMMYECQR